MKNANGDQVKFPAKGFATFKDVTTFEPVTMVLKQNAGQKAAEMGPCVFGSLGCSAVRISRTVEEVETAAREQTTMMTQAQAQQEEINDELYNSLDMDVVDELQVALMNSIVTDPLPRGSSSSSSGMVPVSERMTTIQ